MMELFIRLQYKMGRLNAEKVRALAPRYLSEAQVLAILKEECVC